MKKNVMLGALTLISAMIFAQKPHGDPKAMADKRSDRMKTELSLNDDQYSRVKAINQKYADRHVALRADTAVSVGTSRNRMKKLMEDHESEIKSVLTTDQWNKYAAMKARRAEDWKKHKHGKTGKG